MAPHASRGRTSGCGTSARNRKVPGTEPEAGPLLTILRDAPWLTSGRARAWCRVIAFLCIVLTVLRWGLIAFGVEFLGDVRNVDFTSFWTASELALRGHPDWAYQPEQHAAAQQSLPGATKGYAAFFYPPVYLLLCLPLALVGFLPSLAIWLFLTGAAWIAVIRRWLPAQAGWLPVLAFPPAWNNFWHGQNGFVSAALLGAGALALDRRPFIAGLWFGCLSFKPQLALVVGPALLAARRWSAIAGAVTSATLLAGASWLIFGRGTWIAFLANTALARQALEDELVGSAKMQSVFAAIRLLGGSVGSAYATQLMVSVPVIIVTMAIAAQRPGGMAEGALMAAASMLASPFLLDYDLVLLSLPMAWLLTMAARDGFLPWEKLALAAVFPLALISRSVAQRYGIPVTPITCLAFLAVVARRAALSGR